jgi:hypothetical protein
MLELATDLRHKTQTSSSNRTTCRRVNTSNKVSTLCHRTWDNNSDLPSNNSISTNRNTNNHNTNNHNTNNHNTNNHNTNNHNTNLNITWVKVSISSSRVLHLHIKDMARCPLMEALRRHHHHHLLRALWAGKCPVSLEWELLYPHHPMVAEVTQCQAIRYSTQFHNTSHRKVNEACLAAIQNRCKA